MRPRRRAQLDLNTSLHNEPKVSSDDFAAIADLLPEPMLLVRLDGTIERCNCAFATHVGKDQVSVAGRRLDSLIRETQSELAEYLHACAERGQMVVAPLTLLRGGEWASYRCDGVMYRAPSSATSACVLLRLVPKPEGVGGFAALNDKIEQLNAQMDRRERVEDTLRQQREILEVTLSSIGDGVIVTDARGNITFLNAVAQTLTGWSLAEATDKPLGQVFRVFNELTGQPAEHPVLSNLRADRVVALVNHTSLLSRDGRRRVPLDAWAAPMQLPGGVPFGIVLIFRDITEKKNAEVGQALLASIIESSADAIVSKTLEGYVTSWNLGASRLFGYSAEEMVGKSITQIIPSELHNEEKEILARLRRGEQIDHFETVRVRKDGRRIAISLTVSPIRNASGAIVGASKVARDISERKQAEAALREADRRKDEFLAMLAHELRNPLAPIRNATALVCRAQDLNPDLHTACGIIDRQVRQMTHLVDDLLDVSRITAGRVRLQEEVLDLSAVLALAIESSRPALENSGNEFALDLPQQPIYVRGDRVRLAQVFSNILGNAAKYTPGGGNVRLELRREDTQAVVRIRDSGIGIPPHMLKFVFDLFAQVDRAYDRTGGGLGVGLTVAKRLVEMHHGRIEAMSLGVNTGSEFVVRLPVIADAQAVQAPRAHDAGARSVRRKVLIADDNQDAAASLGMLLHVMGHETRLAHDGLEALEAAEVFRPDIVLLDIGMPQLNGYETARRLRARPWAASTVLIALTGWGQEADRRRARDAGFHHHVVKPLDPDVLAEMLEHAGTASVPDKSANAGGLAPLADRANDAPVKS
jgi:PAS domain S-box-containing protein